MCLDETYCWLVHAACINKLHHVLFTSISPCLFAAVVCLIKGLIFVTTPLQQAEPKLVL